MLVFQSVNGYNLFNCSANDEGRRLDRVLKKMLPDVPAGLLYSGIRKGLIKVNGKKSRQSYLVQENDVIAVRESIKYREKETASSDEPRKSSLIESISIFRNENLLILNKPAGMLTHGHDSIASLIDAGLTGITPSLSFKPAPLHRLDRNTSGLLAVSLSIKGASHFSELVRSRSLDKYYIGICLGEPVKSLKLSDRLVRSGLKTSVIDITSGDSSETRIAETIVKKLLSKDGYSLCMFKIETGLTHQIRAQAAAAGFPLAGDKKYSGASQGFKGYILHAFAISTGSFDEICGFKSCFAPLPEKSYSKAVSIFGRKELQSAIEELKIEINS